MSHISTASSCCFCDVICLSTVSSCYFEWRCISTASNHQRKIKKRKRFKKKLQICRKKKKDLNLHQGLPIQRLAAKTPTSCNAMQPSKTLNCTITVSGGWWQGGGILVVTGRDGDPKSSNTVTGASHTSSHIFDDHFTRSLPSKVFPCLNVHSTSWLNVTISNVYRKLLLAKKNI